MFNQENGNEDMEEEDGVFQRTKRSFKIMLGDCILMKWSRGPFASCLFVSAILLDEFHLPPHSPFFKLMFMDPFGIVTFIAAVWKESCSLCVVQGAPT